MHVDLPWVALVPALVLSKPLGGVDGAFRFIPLADDTLA